MKRSVKNILATIILFTGVMTLDLYAPPGGPGGVSGSGAGCWPPPCIPIDGGISLLIAAGVALGGRQIFRAIK